MSIRMLIDASHQEETRVAIVDGNRVEDFDYESSSKKQLKGSIYLAKVTRVEPSLQAAFVDYGGNRHGFLAFSEIHPDYYQIPVADREALIAEEAAANADLLEVEAKEQQEKPKKRRRRPRRRYSEGDAENHIENTEDENSASETADNVEIEDEEKTAEADALETDSQVADDNTEKQEVPDGNENDLAAKRNSRRKRSKTKAETTKADNVITEDVANEDNKAEEHNDDHDEAELMDDEFIENGDLAQESHEEVNAPSEEEEEERLRIKMAKRLRYKYKIQEVIKKNQIILIQVVKEERGNKGAALTTYLSLPGRYCVLMPNTLHGGGVSRKIANVKDRKKLKNILSELNMPKGHACIIRTAGSDRTKLEIKRDYDYLKRMWDAIRELTLKSIAPTQIYEEGNLIKRSIRDLYTRDISEIIVEGERGYKTAKNFMSMLMPSHAKKIHHYVDPIPLFQRYKVEAHLDSMYSPTAQLKSGGYIVINPTEALVSIDVNSGRATKEHNIEETALKTNLEAAEEIARQLKLRDMAGLVVIDFIDMEENRNNRAVERKMKDCLKADRARIQVGRISSFGLMEMSRQRLRVGVLESSTTPCPHCEGSGVLRSVESQSLHILRIIEEEGSRSNNSHFTVYLPSRIAIYLLNNKRENLISLEKRNNFSVSIAIDSDLTASAYRMDKSGKPSGTLQNRNDSLRLGHDVNTLIDVTEEDVSPKETNNEKSKRRRRRRKSSQNKNNSPANETDENSVQAEEDHDRPRRKRRSRRGRRRDFDHKPENNTEETDNKSDLAVSGETKTVTAEVTEKQETKEETKPKPKPRRNRKVQDDAETEKNTEQNIQVEDVSETVAAKVEEKPKPKRATRTRKKPVEEKTETSEEIPADKKPAKSTRKRTTKKTDAASKAETVTDKETGSNSDTTPVEVKPKKKGWWSR
ncbi:MAG: Rne/Rng family ribonuclease [Emcibacteraceae bacterium]